MSTPIDILPFISPLTDPSLTEVDFSIAVDEWNEALGRILRYNASAFWTEIYYNDTLSRFLNDFLGEYASFRGKKDDIWVMELEHVVRRVFMIYKRLSETIDSIEASAASAMSTSNADDCDPGSILLDQGLVSTSVLLDLAGIFWSSDPETVSKVVGSILEHTPSLTSDFRHSTTTAVQIIRSIQKKFEKGVSGGAGKGKGKGKIAVRDNPVAAELAEATIDPQKRRDAFQYGIVLLDIAHALDALSSASLPLTSELRVHGQFLQSLSGCYNYTLPVLSKFAKEFPLDQDDIETLPTAALHLLRLKMLSIVHTILDAISVEHHPDLTQPVSESDASAMTDTICTVLMGVFEQSPMKEGMAPMDSAPMILDLEIHFNIADKLTEITAQSFGGENDRLMNLATILRNLREFNTATEDYIDAHNLKKSESLARHMSNVYLQEDKDRSNSTLHGDFHQDNHQHLDIRSASSEEDYVKRTVLISQLQDLFADLGEGFLEACLKVFNDDPEVVTMALLEENLPADLVTMDRSTARLPYHGSADMAVVQVPSAPTDESIQDVLATRRNIFDGDEFDMFSGKTVDRTKISRGKRGQATTDVVLDDKSFVEEHKSAILQAAEAMYDDEYDDTYDSMGLNNTSADFKLVDDIDANAEVKTTVSRAEMHIDPSIEYESVLINMYSGQKEVFNRSAEARRSKKRQELRNLTKMTDEQLEGWAIMFGRNPRKAEITQKYEFNGQQTVIESMEPVDKRRGGRMPFVEKNPTQGKQSQGQGHGQQQQQHQKQHQAPSLSSQKPTQRGSDKGKQGQQSQGQSQGQGQGEPQRTAGEQQAKKQTPKADPNARAKNERQKASKANHNRRNQHAKKMASMNP
ncbi:hypothetical protein BG004_002155 [Podila humilis]|nr:hypothetical protein BG004_002155 [Podila humilis]